MKTVNEIIENLEVKEILVKASNYIQWIDKEDNFCEAEKDYRADKWFIFKTTGKSDNPNETFIKYID